MSLENLTDEQIKNLAELSHSLSSDPATRKSFQRLIKQKNPNTVFPELEVEDAVAAASADLAKKQEESAVRVNNMELALKRKELQDDLSSKFPGLKFDDIEKAMVDNGIANHETAATFLQNQRLLAEPAPEVPGRGGPMMMPETAKAFFKSPTQVARKLASEAMDDIIRNRRRAA